MANPSSSHVKSASSNVRRELIRKPQRMSKSTATARSIALAARSGFFSARARLASRSGKCEQARDIAGFIELSQATAIAFGHLTPVAGIELAADLLQGGEGLVIQTAIVLADQAHGPGEVVNPLGLLAGALEKEAQSGLKGGRLKQDAQRGDRLDRQMAGVDERRGKLTEVVDPGLDRGWAQGTRRRLLVERIRVGHALAPENDLLL